MTLVFDKNPKALLESLGESHLLQTRKAFFSKP